MSPISSLCDGAGALPSVRGTATGAAAPAATTTTTTTTPAQAPAACGAPAVPAAACAMAAQVVSALRASFSCAPAATPAAAATSSALTPSENAGQSFTSAVAWAVQSGDGSDSSLDAVRQTVLQAMGDVSQFLLGMGAAPADVSAAGGSLQSRLEALLSAVAPGAGVAGQATLVQKEKATLQIRTAEGDVVTLRIRARSSSTATLAAGAGADGTAAGAAGVTTVDGARISVDVHGNISASEAAAIGDVVKQVEALADQFFGGDVAQAFASAGSLQIDSTQLASVALSLRYQATCSVAGVVIAPLPASAPAAGSAGTAGATDGTGATGADSAVAPATTATPAAPDASAATTAGTSPAAAPASDAAPAPPTPSTPPTLLSVLQDFLQQVLDLALGSAGGASGSVGTGSEPGTLTSAHVRLKLLLAATETLAASAPATTDAGSGSALARLGSVVGSISTQLSQRPARPAYWQ